MRILITGNMGYVGPMVVRHLRATMPEAELIGFDAGFFGHCLTGCRDLPEAGLARQVYGDVRTLAPGLLAGVDAVVHLAAISNDPMGNRFAAVTDEINHRASVRLARMAREAGVKKFVFASSCSVYGAGSDAPRTERDATHPLTAYARSKIAVEQALTAMERGDMVVTCLRFATACGASDRLRLDLVVNDFVASALTQGTIEILSDGTPWRPLIDVADMARAIEWAVRRPAAQGGGCLVVNAGSDAWNLRLHDLAQTVALAIDGVDVHINPDAAPDKRSYRVDFALFRALAPDHQPRMTMAHTITRLRAVLAAAGFADRAFRTGALTRLHVLDRLIATGRLDDALRWIEPLRQAA